MNPNHPLGISTIIFLGSFFPFWLRMLGNLLIPVVTGVRLNLSQSHMGNRCLLASIGASCNLLLACADLQEENRL